MATFRKVKGHNFLELCRTGTAQEISDAINSGVDVNYRDEEEDFGFTALNMAARENTPDVVRLLIKSGADTNSQTNDGNTALMWASLRGNEDIITSLLDAGADVNLSRADGLTALMAAAKKSTPRVIDILLKAGANVNAKDSNGMTALHHAAMNNPDPEAVNTLIEAGSEDITANNGRDALIFAAMLNTPGVVAALLEAGADVNTKDVFGKTALEHAAENPKLKDSPVLRRLEELTQKRG